MALFRSKLNESESALALLQEEFTALNQTHDSLKEELKSAQESGATYLAEFARVDAENKELLERVSTLEADIVATSRDAAEFDDKVASAVAAKIATLGHESVEALEEDDAPVDVVKTFKGLKGAEALAFYHANRKDISKALKPTK